MKKLKTLEKQGYIEIYDVKLENGRENKKVKEKILPVLVLGHTRLDECILAGEDTIYEDVRKIIGRENIKDAMHLEAHIRNGHDYFVTEDTDFLKVRDVLQKRFTIKIVTPDELISILMDKYAE